MHFERPNQHISSQMKVNSFKSLVLLQIICLLLLSSVTYSQGYGVKTVVLDPGHGGKDPGAVGKRSKEKDIVLNVALLAGKYIEENIEGVNVVYTRKTDVYPALMERTNIAKKAKADLFISIHANAAGSKSAYGAENFVLGTNKSENNLKIAQKENSVITFEENYEETYEGFDPNSPASYIIFNFMQDAHQEQSMLLASLIQNQYTKRVGRKDREVRQAPFLVLSTASMPAVLTELGYISNENEEKFLISPEGQDYMASAIFRAVRDYKKEIDAKQSLKMTEEEVAELDQEVVNAVPQKQTVSHFGVVYKLQIFSKSEVLKSTHPAIKDLKDIDYYVDGNSYKYTLGYSADMGDIKKLQKANKNTYKGCFIVAFKDGKRISLDEAKKYSKENK